MNTYIYTEHDSCIQQMMQKSVVTSRELQHIYLPVCNYTNVYRRDVDLFHISTHYNTDSYWRQYHDMTFWGLNAMINLNLTIQSPPTFTVRALVRCVPVRVCMTTAGTGPVSRVTCHAAEQTSTSHHTLLPAPHLYIY